MKTRQSYHTFALFRILSVCHSNEKSGGYGSRFQKQKARTLNKDQAFSL
jgi:hypothetical protein